MAPFYTTTHEATILTGKIIKWRTTSRQETLKNMKKRAQESHEGGNEGAIAGRSTNWAKLEVWGKNTADGKQKPTTRATPAAVHLDLRFSVHKLHSIRK